MGIPMRADQINRPNSVLSNVYNTLMHRLCVHVRSHCIKSQMRFAKTVATLNSTFIDDSATYCPWEGYCFKNS